MMPTKRTWRDHARVEFLSAYQYHELLTGNIDYPMMRYDGYGDGGGKDLHAFIHPADARRLGDPSRGAARVLDQRSAVLRAPEQKAVAALLRRAGHAPVGVVAPRGSSAARRRRDRGRIPDAA